MYARGRRVTSRRLVRLQRSSCLHTGSHYTKPPLDLATARNVKRGRDFATERHKKRHTDKQPGSGTKGKSQTKKHSKRNTGWGWGRHGKQKVRSAECTRWVAGPAQLHDLSKYFMTYRPAPSTLAQAVTFQNCNVGVPGSTPGRDTHYPEYVFSWYSSAPEANSVSMFLLVSWSGVGLCQLGTSATVCPTVPAPARWWWGWSNWKGKPKYSEKTCPTATLSATNPTSGLEAGTPRWEAGD
jgi:hypothetical protein